VSSFVPGLEFSRAFYEEVVRPIVSAAAPKLEYAAALIGPGSEVLGFDTEQSTDHDWGPRLQVFLTVPEYERFAAAIGQALSRRLPPTFRGYSTRFGAPDSEGVRVMAPAGEGGVHGVEISTIIGITQRWLGFDPRRGISLLDWLLTPSQRLLELTAGAVFRDDTGAVGRIRAALAWYPHDVWLYLIACQWRRIGEEEAFVGRAGQAGDELGSAVVGARLVRDLMRLCFLLERRYAPYSKWLGSAFARLACSGAIAPALEAALAARDWQTRERHLATAYELVAGMHNALGITPLVDPETRPFHNRPFRVLMASRFADAARRAITSEEVRRLPAIGSVDQFVDNTEVLSKPAHWRYLASVLSPEC
jgi:hypothetical protein